jgi:hypothetical protein
MAEQQCIHPSATTCRETLRHIRLEQLVIVSQSSTVGAFGDQEHLDGESGDPNIKPGTTIAGRGDSRDPNAVSP